MTASYHQYPQFNQKALTKNVDLSADAMKVLLLSAYTYANSHATLTNVLAAGTELSTANGYTAGGLTLSGVTLTTSGLVTTLTATSPTVTVPQAGSLAFAYVVFVDTQGGTNGTSYPVGYWDLGGTSTFNDTTSGTEVVTITIPAGGIATWTAS